jgi:alpha-galactosidase
LELKYVSHKTEKVDANSSLTSIVFKDPVYPFEVTLFYKVWPKESNRTMVRNKT